MLNSWCVGSCTRGKGSYKSALSAAARRRTNALQELTSIGRSVPDRISICLTAFGGVIDPILMSDWEGLRDALRYQPYSSKVEHGAWQLSELLQTASASKPLKLDRCEGGNIDGNPQVVIVIGLSTARCYTGLFCASKILHRRLSMSQGTGPRQGPLLRPRKLLLPLQSMLNILPLATTFSRCHKVGHFLSACSSPL